MESILAHEIGHFKKKHIIKSMVLSFIIILAGFLLIHALRDYQPLFNAFGVSGTGDHILIVLLIYFASPVVFFLTPVFSFLSRKHEYEADRYAAQAVSTGKYLILGLKKLAAKNLSNLMPHKVYSTFHYSHPALNERINNLSAADTV